MLSGEAQLYERIEQLEAEVAYWKAEAVGAVDGDRLATIQKALGLTHAQAWIVNRLHAVRGRFVPRATLSHEMPGWKDADERWDSNSTLNAHVSRIRRKLGWEAVESIRKCGYRLTEAGMAAVESALKNSTTG